MWWCCVQRSSVWSDDRAADRDAHLDCSGCDRSPSWIYGLEGDGADGAQRESVFRTCVRVSRTPRRSDQDVVVERRWSVPFREKIGARKIHLAASHEPAFRKKTYPDFLPLARTESISASPEFGPNSTSEEAKHLSG